MFFPTPAHTLVAAADALQHNQPQEALKLIDHMLNTHPTTHMTALLGMRGVICTELDDHVGARAAFRKALKQHDNEGTTSSLRYAQTLNLLAAALDTEDLFQALQYHERALAIYTDQRAVVLTKKTYALDYIATLLILGVVAEQTQHWLAANHYYAQAHRACTDLRLSLTHRFWCLVTDGQERVITKL